MKPVNCTLALLLVAVAACASEDSRPSRRIDRSVEELTQAHTRVVWVQDTEDMTDVFARGSRLRLMGYDNRDGKGERVILPGPANFSKPLITPDGNRIIYSDFDRGRTFIVGWDGSGRRKLTDGMALAVWLDPQTGTEWVYVGRDRDDRRGDPYRTVVRMPIDQPEQTELVWNRTPVDAHNFQLSADGTRASGVFPWPECGVATLPNGRLQRFGRGCWTSLAPDNSYTFWYFDGSHRNVLMADARTDRRWQVNINNAPGIEGFEVYHPRWSNHPRYMTMTGPYKIRTGGNNIRGGGPDVEIHIGRFNEDLTAIEQWARVTRNRHADFHPDVWIDPGDRAWAAASAEPVPSSRPAPQRETDAWPVIRDRLEFIWGTRSTHTEILDADGGIRHVCHAEPVGQARYGRHLEMDVREGWFVAEHLSERLLSSIQDEEAFSIELTITPEQARDGAIVSFGSSAQTRNVALIEQDGNLVLELRGARQGGRVYRVELMELENGRPVHLIFSLDEHGAALYRDGVRIWNRPGRSRPFPEWTEQPLTFGGQSDGRADWSGYIEGIALYSRGISPDEAARKYEARVREQAGRPPAPTPLEVEAKLIYHSDIPTPAAIEPYRRALVASEYELVRVIEGQLEDERIMVAHWVILDGVTLDTAQRETGRVYRMRIEPYNARPELEGERLAMDSDDLLLPVFLDLGY